MNVELRIINFLGIRLAGHEQKKRGRRKKDKEKGRKLGLSLPQKIHDCRAAARQVGRTGRQLRQTHGAAPQTPEAKSFRGESGSRSFSGI